MCVEFVLSDKRIEILEDGKVKTSASIALNNEGRCMLVAAGSELESWQLRKMALDNLFFG